MAVVYITHEERAGWATIPPALIVPDGRVVNRDARRSGQATARGRRDVRRRGGPVRPDQHRAVVRPGSWLAPGHSGGARAAAGRAGPGRRRRDGRVDRGTGPVR